MTAFAMLDNVRPDAGLPGPSGLARASLKPVRKSDIDFDPREGKRLT